MSTNVPNLKQIGGGHRKNGQKFVDLMWNDPYQYPGSFIRNHRQFRVKVPYCEDFRINLKPLFLNLHDRHRPIVTLLTVI